MRDEQDLKSFCGIDLATIPVEGEISDNNLLFSESHGRYIVTVKSDAVDDILTNIDVPCACIGEVKGDSLKILNNGETVVDLPVKDLDEAYYGVIEQYMA